MEGYVAKGISRVASGDPLCNVTINNFKLSKKRNWGTRISLGGTSGIFRYDVISACYVPEILYYAVYL